MGKTDELEKLEKTIKDTEARLKTLQTNMEALDKEIKNISTFESVLVENVRILKTKKVIAIAKEFSNAKDELKRVKKRLVVLHNDREHFNKSYQDVEVFLQNVRLQYDKVLNSGKDNVLSFRREDGKK